MTRTQNWGMLLAAVALAISLAAVLDGARIYRWEAVVWLAVGIIGNFCGWCYSRWWSRRD